MKHENNSIPDVQIQAPVAESQAQRDYRAVLAAELVRKQAVNPRYSLRRFALHLGISAATLCGVLKRSRKLSIGTAQKVALRLELDGDRRSEFLLSVAEDFQVKREEVTQPIGA